MTRFLLSGLCFALLLLTACAHGVGGPDSVAIKRKNVENKEAAAQKKPKAGRLLTGFLQVNGLRRSHLLYIPNSYNASKPVPILLALHGGGSSAYFMRGRGYFDRVADREGFLVVYPNAVHRHWNDGRTGEFIPSANIDDVAYISSLIDELSKTYRVDPNRIYVTGLSNGGMMSHRIGMELSDKVAAIAPVAAAIPKTLAEKREDPPHPVPVLMINGTHDPAILYNGTDANHWFLGRRVGPILSVAETEAIWLAYNDGEAGPARTLELPDTVEDGMRTTGVSHVARNGAEVVLYTVQNGGHGIPGGGQYLPSYLIGRISRDYDGAQVIWEFFKRHPRR